MEKEIVKLMDFASLLFKKTIHVALKAETRIDLQVNRLLDFLAKFKYFIEHLFLVMLVMVVFLFTYGDNILSHLINLNSRS